MKKNRSCNCTAPVFIIAHPCFSGFLFHFLPAHHGPASKKRTIPRKSRCAVRFRGSFKQQADFLRCCFSCTQVRQIPAGPATRDAASFVQKFPFPWSMKTCERKMTFCQIPVNYSGIFWYNSSHKNTQMLHYTLPLSAMSRLATGTCRSAASCQFPVRAEMLTQVNKAAGRPCRSVTRCQLKASDK